MLFAAIFGTSTAQKTQHLLVALFVLLFVFREAFVFIHAIQIWKERWEKKKMFRVGVRKKREGDCEGKEGKEGDERKERKEGDVRKEEMKIDCMREREREQM